jgi:hypothetical protein
MSELKAINAYQLTTNTEDSDVYIRNDEFGCGGDLVECYLKSEADKVIAELKKACNDKDDWCLHTLKENRHHKYKRCLAMADYCYTNVHCIMGHRLCAFADWKKEWFERWHKRWLELAEKFKEGPVIGVDKAIGTDKMVVINHKEAKC